jgi:hypothetical protein
MKRNRRLCWLLRRCKRRGLIIVVVFTAASCTVVHLPGAGETFLVVAKQTSREVAGIVRSLSPGINPHPMTATAGIRN